MELGASGAKTVAMSQNLNAATFQASFPPIQTALNRSGNGDGMRVKLDIPESEMGEGLKLFGMTGAVLRVTIEVQGNGDDYGGRLKDG